MADLFKYLQERPYPGRGILLGNLPEGQALCAYFIMGRSENSRNRILKSPKTASAPRLSMRARWWIPL